MSSLAENASAMLAKKEQSPEPGVADYSNDEEFLLLRNQLRHLSDAEVKSALEYGFYQHKRCYWMRRRADTFEPVSNFTMKVLYLIQGANPKRIVEITNVRGRGATLDFAIEDLISIEKFKGKVESQGNFLFEGKASDLARIKSRLFENEKPSLEVARLGTHRDGFFAWANGVYDGQEFSPVDDTGMVEWKGQHYYIPVFGATRADDDEDLRNYRKFLHRETPITFAEWAEQFVKVYGENGMVGIAFALFSLYSDIIFDKTKAAPMLFLFGQRGSGKGTMANSLLTLYGFPQDPLMLGGASTVVGFMRKLGQFSNAITWLDEYKNDIGEKKIESLKNIWDRVGYERGVKDQSNRTQTTPVTSSAIISGQEMPNIEPALFSRCLLCEFKAMQRTQEEVNQFQRLRRMEEEGVTNATLEAMRYRKQVKEQWQKKYSEMAATFRAAFNEEDVIERQIINFSILVTVTWICEEAGLRLPFTHIDLSRVAERSIVRQRDMMKTSNEVQQFFEMVQYLLTAGELKEGEDVELKEGLVKLRLTKVVPLYREHSRRQQLRCLDRGTLQNYLEASEAYHREESKKSSHRFRVLQNPTSATVFLQSKIAKLYGVDFGENAQTPDTEIVTGEQAPF